MSLKPRLFLDTSVIMAAVFSPRGGSSGIIDLAKSDMLDLVITESVVLEAHRKLKRKYSQKEQQVLQQILAPLRTSIKPSASSKEIKQFDHLINDVDDRHVLAGAAKYYADYIITLDRKHFMTEQLQATVSLYRIMAPGEFLRHYREQSRG